MQFWRFVGYKRCMPYRRMEIKTKIKKQIKYLLLKNDKEMEEPVSHFRWKSGAKGRIRQNNMQDNP